jgi:hypothetical protein
MTIAWIKEPLQHFHKDTYLVDGRFRFNGSSAPTSVVGAAVQSVAHTATGVWTVTLKPQFRNWRGVLSRQVSLELDASALTVLHMGPAVAAAGTFVVRAQTEAAGTLALANVASGSNAGNWCHFSLLLKYGTSKDGSGV